MSPIDRKLRHVQRRLAIQRWIHGLVSALLWAVGIAGFTLLVSRLFVTPMDPLAIAAVLGGVAFIVATIWAIMRRPQLIESALAADERLGLRERLTSSLQLRGAAGSMTEALHADAARHAEGIVPARDFPFFVPRRTRWLAVGLAVFGCLYIAMPEFDLLGYKDRQAQAKAEEQKRMETIERIEEAIEPLKEQVKVEEENIGLETLTGDIDAILEDFKHGKINEKQMLAKLLNKAEALKQQQAELAQSTPKMSHTLSDLNSTAEMAKHMQQGKFDEATKAMEELKKKLEEGSLSQEEQQQLAEELNKLSESLSTNGTPSSEALKEALANTAKAMQAGDLQTAMEGMGMAEMSMQDLQSAMEQLEKLEMAQAKLGKACENCGVGQGQFGKAGMGAGKGPGMWGQGQGDKGPGMGGPGQGRGGQIGELPETNTGFSPTMLPGGIQDGPMLATITETAPPDAEGEESTINFAPVNMAIVRQEAERALEQEEIPPGAREFVRQYFGTMEQSATDDATQ